MNPWDEPDGLLLVRIEHITEKTFRNGRKYARKRRVGKRREIHVQGNNAEAAVVRGRGVSFMDTSGLLQIIGHLEHEIPIAGRGSFGFKNA
jgi:hypothetical protein